MPRVKKVGPSVEELLQKLGGEVRRKPGRPRKVVPEAEPENPTALLEKKAAGEKEKKEAKKKSKETGLLIPQLRLSTAQLLIRNKPGSPLVVHNWSKKAIEIMLAKQMGIVTSAKKAPKNPTEDFLDSLYWLSERPDEISEDSVDGGVFGFKSLAFKNAAIAACRSLDGVPMTQARQWFHVWGTDHRQFVTLQNHDGTPAIPICRRDMVRVQTTTDIRFRGEFPEWQAYLQIEFNSGAVKLEQIVNLINLAGFGVGIGEQRPDKNGAWGMFEVVIS